MKLQKLLELRRLQAEVHKLRAATATRDSSRYLNDPAKWVADRLGEFLWSKQRQIAESVVTNRRTAVKSCHNAGKCVYSQSMLPLADGRLAKAEELIGTTFEVLAYGPDGEQIPSKAWATDNGIKPTFRVRTSHGREVIRTGNHPLFRGVRTGGGPGKRSVVTSIGWTNVEDLKVGDLVLVPERLNMPQGDSPLTDDQVKLLGYLLGDGGTTRDISFTQEPGRPLDEFCEIAVRLGGKVDRTPSSRYTVTIHAASGRSGRAGSNPVLNFVREHGMFGVRAKEKHFPAVAWQLPDTHLALLLNRLFACDGYAYVRSDRGTERAQIGITLASHEMIREIEIAALRLGVVGQTRKRAVKLNGKVFDAWEWVINRAEDQLRFAEVVGIFGKEAAISRVVEVASRSQRPSRWMRRECPTGYRWEVVAEIESMGELPTVVISVETHHTFLTTFVEHNSWIAARLAAWWLDTHPPGEAFVVSTAPTYKQVHAILWEEIRAAARKAAGRGAPLPGRVLQSDEWKLDDGTLIGFGRKPADTDEHGFQGIHRRYVLVILDEACGVPAQLWTAVEAITTNADCRILAIGNPDDPSTEFNNVCKPASGWNVIQINGLETPNMTADRVAEHPRLAALFERLGLSPSVEFVPDGLRPLMLDPEWVADKVTRWGVESPRFTSKVLGDFPDIGEDVLIPPSLIEAAQQRTLDPGPRAVLGVDVARFGSDRTVIYLRRGPLVRLVGEHSKLPTTETTGHVVAAKRETNADEIRVDGVGVGAGVVDQLVEFGHDVVDVQAGARAFDPELFINLRAEAYWGLRQRFEQGDMDLDPADDELAAQLGTLRYKFTARGQIQIESKDDMRKRGLPSPDRADAVMLTSVASPPPADTVVEPEEFTDDDAYSISPV